MELSLDQAPFANLQSRGEDGDLEAYSLGWAWSWNSAAYGHFSLEPENTNTSTMPSETNGFYLDWHTTLE
jgi:peptide/nickel transport system substrate-binding protein